MQRRKQRVKLAENVGNRMTSGNNGADWSQLVMRQLADVSGFVSVAGLQSVGQTDNKFDATLPATLKNSGE